MATLSALPQVKSVQIGLKITNGFTSNDDYVPGFGGQFVYRFSKHGGIESGIYYQSRYITSFQTEWQILNGGNISEVIGHRLQFPVFYRFDSKAVNFTAGPVLDIGVGNKIKTDDPDPVLKNYKWEKTVLITIAGVSKTFTLSHEWLLEPEAQFTYIIDNDVAGISLNLSLRKKIL